MRMQAQATSALNSPQAGLEDLFDPHGDRLQRAGADVNGDRRRDADRGDVDLAERPVERNVVAADSARHLQPAGDERGRAGQGRGWEQSA